MSGCICKLLLQSIYTRLLLLQSNFQVNFLILPLLIGVCSLWSLVLEFSPELLHQILQQLYLLSQPICLILRYHTATTTLFHVNRVTLFKCLLKFEIFSPQLFQFKHAMSCLLRLFQGLLEQTLQFRNYSLLLSDSVLVEASFLHLFISILQASHPFSIGCLQVLVLCLQLFSMH